MRAQKSLSSHVLLSSLESLRNHNGNRNDNLDRQLRSSSASSINFDYDAFSETRTTYVLLSLVSFIHLVQNYVTPEQRTKDFSLPQDIIPKGCL